MLHSRLLTYVDEVAGRIDPRLASHLKSRRRDQRRSWRWRRNWEPALSAPAEETDLTAAGEVLIGHIRQT